MMEDRLPPNNKEAELGVLGGILRDPQVLDDAIQFISERDFYFDAHQKVFKVLTELAHDNPEMIDITIVADRLNKSSFLEDVGGLDFLADLWGKVQTGANVRYHSQIIRNAALLRGLIHASTETLRDVYDSTASPEELIAQAEQKIFSLHDSQQSEEPISALQLSQEGLERIDARHARSGPDGLATGFEDLDCYLDGMKGGNLIVVGGRPGAGKSALALAITLNLSEESIPVYFASLEMSRVEITDRILAMRSRVPLKLIGRGQIDAEQSGRIVRAGNAFGMEPFHLHDHSGITAARLASNVRRAIRKQGAKLIVVDYLQLMTPENRKDQRYLQVGMLALRMKELARSCNVPVVLLSQLNRESESRSDNKPKLSDLRESGDIEAHADVVLLMHPHIDPATKNKTGLHDVIVAKQRNGPVGEVTLCYHNTIARFENAAK